MNRKIKFAFFSAAISSGILPSSNLWAQQAGAGQEAKGPMQTLSFFFPLILIVGIFYLLIIRPQQKQAKQRQAMIAAVTKGDIVITVGGIHGRITGVADNVLTVEIADNCRVKVERSSIQGVTVPKETDES